MILPRKKPAVDFYGKNKPIDQRPMQKLRIEVEEAGTFIKCF